MLRLVFEHRELSDLQGISWSGGDLQNYPPAPATYHNTFGAPVGFILIMEKKQSEFLTLHLCLFWIPFSSRPLRSICHGNTPSHVTPQGCYLKQVFIASILKLKHHFLTTSKEGPLVLVLKCPRITLWNPTTGEESFFLFKECHFLIFPVLEWPFWTSSDFWLIAHCTLSVTGISVNYHFAGKLRNALYYITLVNKMSGRLQIYYIF